MRRVSAFAALVISVAGMPPVSSAQERGAVYRTPPPMNVTVEDRVRPQIETLLEALAAEGRGYTLDGVEVFEAQDKFLPGKIASGMAHVLVATRRDDPAFAGRLAAFRRLSDLTLEDTNDSWGIYYYISALHELKTAGLLDEAVAPATLARLRERLDWRAFVREPDLTLIDLPNNYFGVAFSIARLRFLLGWEEASASEALLAKTLQHFRDYSGEYGFADETSGEGRFDRYSVLLIGEIAQRFIETGVEPPPEVRTWLRKSVDLMLQRLNMRGEGFEYGRSIGVYGETAFLEVLTAAAALDVLTDEEQTMAYAFSSRVAARYVDFWIDSGTGSVNLWDHGRKTDAYRGKHRILGENLSLAHQLIYTNAIWNRLGLVDRDPDPGFEAWLGRLPRSTTTWFSRGDYDRLVVTYRDGDRVIGLPLINGGPTQHMNTPYFPIPFSPGLLAGAADETFPQLIPRVTLADGAVLAPLAWFRDVEVKEEGAATLVSYRSDGFDLMGETAPRRDERASARTRYVLGAGFVSRTDDIEVSEGAGPGRIDLEFPTFSSGGVAAADGSITFARGEVVAFEPAGLECEVVEAPDSETYASPVGAMRSLVRCHADIAERATVSWRIRFRS